MGLHHSARQLAVELEYSRTRSFLMTSELARRLTGKVAIITGATGGIGREIARSFADHGATLVLTGRRAQTMPGGRATYVACDVGDEEQVRSIVQLAIDRHGRVDVLVNAHGVDFHSDLAVTDAVDVAEVLRINLIGSFLTMKYVIPAMARSGGGSIVNLTSRLASVAIPTQAIYSASKAALTMLSRGAAIDYARQGIRVNCLAPGPTNTEMTRSWIRSQDDPRGFEAKLAASVPLGRLAEPSEIADAALFLASDEASYITGAILPVDGGYTAR